MPTGECAQCGAETVPARANIQIDVTMAQAPDRIYVGKAGTSALDAAVCASCGRVEFRIPSDQRHLFGVVV